MVLVAIQLSVLGLYLPPVFKARVAAPNDHFAAGPDCRVRYRAEGALVVLVATHVSSMQPPEGLAITGSW